MSAELATTTDSVPQLANVQAGFGSLQSFELIQRAGKLLSASNLVPKDYQGNIANCVIAINLAMRVGADPLQVMQNLNIIHGKPGWSSQFLIATFNQCGRFTSMRFAFFGEKNSDDWGCRAYATERATGEKLEGADVTIGIAKQEGWYAKAGSKWKTMPQQMLMYRAASWFVRAYAPELSMGLQTQDELQDVIDTTQLSDGSFGVSGAPNRPTRLAAIVGTHIASAEPESPAAVDDAQPEPQDVDDEPPPDDPSGL